jgi:ribosomal protein S18 acetylase RimI-like enzyme
MGRDNETSSGNFEHRNRGAAMSPVTPVPLVPVPIGIDSPEFKEICGWRFEGHEYIGRLLREDIPERVRRGSGRIWIYRDPQAQVVGFGTLDVRDHYSDFTGGRLHPYIPLLAVNPTIKSLGYGASIVAHLIGEAARLAGGPGDCVDVLFLDVYASNEKAIRLYERCGFVMVSDRPRLDPDQDHRPYIIMARSVP